MLPLTKENANGQYAIVQPIRIFFVERCNYYLLLLNRVFVIAPHLHHSDKKLGGGVWVGCYIREFKEFKEIKEFKEFGSMCYL